MRQLAQESAVPVTTTRISLRKALPERRGVIRLFPKQETRRGTPIHYEFGIWQSMDGGWAVRGRHGIIANEHLVLFFEEWSR